MGEGGEGARAAAGRLAEAVRALPEAAEGVGEDVREAVGAALQRLAETGEEPGEEVLEQLKGLGKDLAGRLDASDLEDIKRAAASVGQEGVNKLKGVWASIQPAVADASAAGQEAADGAAEAARAAAEVAAPVLSDAAQAAGEGARAVKGAAFDVYNKAEVQDVLGGMWVEVDEAYNMGMDEVRTAMLAIEGLAGAGLLACCGPGGIFEDLLKGEIFRDSFQALGLFFSQAIRDTGRFVKLARAWMGRAANIVALDFFEVVHSEVFQQVTIGLAFALAVFMIIAFAWFAKKALRANPDALREGHESKSWKQRKLESAKEVRIMGLILTVGTTAYLPVSRVAVEILVCSTSFVDTLRSVSTGNDLFLSDGKCGTGLIIFAVAALLFFSLPFPIAVAYAIWRNKPRGSLENPDVTHDEDGIEVPFDDKRYLERCQNDPNQLSCPYNSLYRGLERQWAFYKVAVMVFKFLMALVAVTLATSLSEKNSAQAGVMLGLQLAFSCLSFYATPFVDPNNDRMDACGRISAIVTAICTLVLALTYDPETENGGSLEDVIGLVLNVAMAVNAVVMVSFVLYSFTKKFWKNLLGRFEFSNTVVNTQGPGFKIIPLWDIRLEVKHRVWHAFWDSFVLKHCGPEVAERMLELKEETRSFGLDKIRMHWEGVADPAIAAARMACLQEWEGVDVFWDDGSKTLDGKLDSQTFFAKLYVSDYPFHIRAIYDDSTDVTFLWDNVDLARFVELQNREDIVARRGVRKKLRALAADGGFFSLPFSRVEQKRVEDGTRTVTDSDGKSHQETVYSTISVTMYYTMGSVFVESNNDNLPMQAGFKCGMQYNDGYGQGVAPRTGQTKHFKNESATMPASHVGVGDGTFAPNERTHEVFKAAESLVEGALPALLQRHQEYKDTLMRTRTEANQILSDGFWYYVYNRPSLSLAQLEHYLENSEKNPVLREMQSKHGEGLAFVYKRMQYCQAHPAFALWYVFWADFWESNRTTSALKGLEERISPASATSIAYLPLPCEQLEDTLSEWGLLGGGACSVRRLLSARTLDALYARMDLEAGAARSADSSDAALV